MKRGRTACPACLACCVPTAGSSEPVRELLDDTGAEHIGHREDLGEDLVERLDVGLPPLLRALLLADPGELT